MKKVFIKFNLIADEDKGSEFLLKVLLGNIGRPTCIKNYKVESFKESLKYFKSFNFRTTSNSQKESSTLNFAPENLQATKIRVKATAADLSK